MDAKDFSPSAFSHLSEVSVFYPGKKISLGQTNNIFEAGFCIPSDSHPLVRIVLN